jgi:hypothetical protein
MKTLSIIERGVADSEELMRIMIAPPLFDFVEAFNGLLHGRYIFDNTIKIIPQTYPNLSQPSR